MFSESWPWKRDLAAANRLEESRRGLDSRLSLGDENGEESWENEMEAVYQVERDAMTAAFAIRRLTGMPSKVTREARQSKAQVTRFPLPEGVNTPDIWDALGTIDMYNFASPQVVRVSANELCNLFVHSFIFKFIWTLESLPWLDYWLLPGDDPRWEVEPTELAGFLIATDKSASQHVSFVSLGELVRVSRIFANDDPIGVKFRRDPRGRMHAFAYGPGELSQDSPGPALAPQSSDSCGNSGGREATES